MCSTEHFFSVAYSPAQETPRPTRWGKIKRALISLGKDEFAIQFAAFCGSVLGPARPSLKMTTVSSYKISPDTVATFSEMRGHRFSSRSDY
jgi:hypothetical protein